MTMNRIKEIFKLCWLELLMILCGAVLVFFPDSAVALATKVLSYLVCCYHYYFSFSLMWL